MLKRAKVVISDDIMTLDETEITFSTKKQLGEMVDSFIRCTQDAEIAEVYDNEGNKMIARYVLTRKGKVEETSVTHFNWGGRRTRSGRKSKGEKCLKNKIFFNVDDEMFDFLDRLPIPKSTWLRQAVQEKRERENNNSNENALDKK